MAKYDAMTDEEFDTLLMRIMDESPASHLLSIPGVYDVLREHFNNDVLNAWEQEKAAEHECVDCHTWIDKPEPRNQLGKDDGVACDKCLPPPVGDECPLCKRGTIVLEDGEKRCAGECGNIWKVER